MLLLHFWKFHIGLNNLSFLDSGGKDIMVGGWVRFEERGLAHPHLVRHPGQHPTNQLKSFYINGKVAPILGHLSRYHQVFDGFLMGNYPESFINSFCLVSISCPHPWQHPTHELPPFYTSCKVGWTVFSNIQWVSLEKLSKRCHQFFSVVVWLSRLVIQSYSSATALKQLVFIPIKAKFSWVCVLVLHETCLSWIGVWLSRWIWWSRL